MGLLELFFLFFWGGGSAYILPDLNSQVANPKRDIPTRPDVPR